MSFLVPLLLVVMGFRDWWEGDDLKRLGSDYGAIRHHSAGAGEVVVGVVVLGLLVNRGSPAPWVFFVAFGGAFLVASGFFFRWRSRRSADPSSRDSQMGVAELALAAGGIALVMYGILQ